MSLNGLDDARVKQAHETAVAEPGGWYVPIPHCPLLLLALLCNSELIIRATRGYGPRLHAGSNLGCFKTGSSSSMPPVMR